MTATLLFQELFISFIIGGIPMLILYNMGGARQMVDSLIMMNPGDEVFIFFIILFIVHIIIVGISRFVFIRSENIEAGISWLHGVSNQVGFSMHGIYRAITGALPVALLLVAFKEGLTGAMSVTFVSAFLLAGSLFMCCVLSVIANKTKRG